MSRRRLTKPTSGSNRGASHDSGRTRRSFAIRATTYADLEKIVQAFARGDLNLLILLGSHGLGKSRILRHALPGGQEDQPCKT